MVETPEEQIARLESELAHLSHDLLRMSPPLTLRYRLNVKDSAAGVRTTDGTVEVFDAHGTLTAVEFLRLQSSFQDVVDAEYPPPTPKGTASSAT